MNSGWIKSNKGRDPDQEQFGTTVEARQFHHSTVLRAASKNRRPCALAPWHDGISTTPG
jgi:hypothetical protein